MISPRGRGKSLTQKQCASQKAFTDTLEHLKTSRLDLGTYSFTFLGANTDKARNMMTKGLKRMCPRPFDPKGEARLDLCVQV
jgi:hypothetical protein